jgi:hypothetical protein
VCARSFVVAELAKRVAAGSLSDHVRCLFAFASHEEIGRFGSRVLAQVRRPLRPFWQPFCFGLRFTYVTSVLVKKY